MPFPFWYLTLLVQYNKIKLFWRQNQRIYKIYQNMNFLVTYVNINLELMEKWKGITVQYTTHEYEISMKYRCTECDYQATTKSSLDTHQSIHNGNKYQFRACEHQSNTKSNFNRHHQSIHEGKKYQCSECEHQSSGVNS